MKKPIFNKIISVVLCIAMLLPLVPVISFSAAAAEVDQSTTQTHTESTYLDGVHYYIEKNISYIGNRSYQLDVKLHTSLTDTDIVLNRNYARNGYFTVEVSGWYLLELWGGEGADGGKSNDVLVGRPGGNGGARGYVYAKVYLEKGQTLAYSIGTDGKQTEISGFGGGINGSGGDKGELGSQWVGGGGGYSALYFFEAGEFDPSWLTDSGYWNLPSSVRLSRYVMVAAGGGGGGAGNGTAWVNTGYANGGAGGNINNNVSMTLSGSGSSVAGYLFFGKNGQSSGTSTAYVGRGGTNVPGSSPSTFDKWYTAEPGPNDWSGAYNLDSTPGAGGSGMFRGGGGGAGFCGGSGGIMTGQTITSNVGGGGGGSSFLASKIGDSIVYFGSDEVDKEKLHGASECPSTEGGAFSYTFLGNENGIEIDTTYLQDVLVEGNFSQYFEVFSSPSTDGTTNDFGVANANGELVFDSESGNFTVTGASIDAASVERDGTFLSMTFLLKAKSAFVGGNNVPLLQSLSITMDRGSSEPTVITSQGEARTDNVNVPLSLSIPTHSKMISHKEGDDAPTFKIADLYTNEHTDTTGWAYDFISSIASPVIYTGNQGTSGSKYTATTTPAITETTYYSVTMKVTPKTDNGYAACGPKNEGTQTFVGVITLTVLDATVFGGEDGWSYDLTANKTLSYDGKNFIFEQSVTQSMTRQYDLTSTAVYNSTNAQNGYSASAFQVQKTGYYLLQVWGANGGKGGNAYAKTPSGTRSPSGGSGGSGAAVYVFAYLEEGDILNFTLGSAGSGGTYGEDIQSSSAYNAAATGGGGSFGRASAIALQKNGTTEAESTYLVIAGGGGGGGGAGAAQGGGLSGNYASKSGSAGSAGSATFNYLDGIPALGSLDNFRGTSGKSGTASTGIIINQGLVSASGGSGGAGGQSYCDAIVANVGKNDAETLYLGRLAETLAKSSDFTKPTSSTSGAVRVSFICDDETTEELAAFPGVEAGGSFSHYFEIPTDKNGVPMIDMGITGVAHDTKETTVNDDGSITVTYYDDEKLMAQFSFVLTEENNITTYDVFGTVYHPTFRVSKVDPSTYIADCGFTISVVLQPREGFLGGNDVPVLDGLDDDAEYTNVYIRKGETIGYLRTNNKSDYANVAVNYDVSSHFAVREGYVILDDGNTENDTVYASDLYTLDIDLSGYADWQKEFVEPLYPEENTYTLTYYTSTTAYLTAGLVPKAEPQKAIIIGDTDGARVTLYTTVYAQYPIYYELGYIDADGPQYVTYSKPTTIRLTPNQGFLMPKAGEVQVLNRYNSNIYFTYDETTGVISISAYDVNSPITVRATALPQPFKIHYVFTFDGVNSEEVVEEYQAGQTIDPTFIDTFLNVYNVEEKEGHTFTWEWETEDGTRPTVMPGKDIWAIGSYVKDRHNLTIHYVDGNGNSIGIPDYTAVLEYGESYAVPTPDAIGYMPISASGNEDNSNPFVISGQMKTEDIDVTVTYAYANNQLVILYLYPNGQQIQRVERELLDGESFEVISPDNIDGYEPDYVIYNGEIWDGDPNCVTGTMPIGGNVLVHVYYKPEKYAVELEYRYEGGTYPKPSIAPADLQYDFTEAVLDDGTDTIYIEYGNIFGYNPEAGTYGLATPIVAGYTFAGWYTDTTFTQRVEEDMIVGLDYPTKLYAKWEPMQYKLILRFNFVEGTYIAPDMDALRASAEEMGFVLESKDSDGDGVVDYYYISLDVYLDEEYSITVPQMVGYTPYIEYGIVGAQTAVEEIAGHMPAFNRIYEITYEVNSYSIQFYAYGGLSHVTFPTYTTVAQDVGPFEVDTLLTESVYEHGEPIVYPDETPNQVREYYTFIPDWWENVGGEIYPADLVATQSEALYAHYYAHENIATVYKNGTYYPSNLENAEVVSRHYNIQDAINAAIAIGYTGSYASEAPVVSLHRFDDVVGEARDIYIEKTINVSGSSGRPMIVLDLNGLTLRASETTFSVDHATFHIENMATETASSIIVESDSDVVAFQQGNASIVSFGGNSYNATITVEARSTNGNAIGVQIENKNDSVNFSLNSGVEVVAEAPMGDAYGILHSGLNSRYSGTYCLSLYNCNISATAGNNAYAVQTEALVGIQSNTALTAYAQNGTAMGINGVGSSSANFESAADATIMAYSVNGNACGVRVEAYYVYLQLSSSSRLSVEAVSENSNAIAMDANPYDTSMRYCTFTAIAPNGEAIAMRLNYTRYAYVYLENTLTLRAEGREAIGFYCNYQTDARISSAITAIGEERAIGVYNPTSSMRTSVRETINLLAKSDEGNAYAIYGGIVSYYSLSSSSSSTITASTQTGSAYALYNCWVENIPSPIVVRAEATNGGNAYGFYVAEGVVGSLYQASGSTYAEATNGGIAYGAYIAGDASIYGSIAATGATAYGVFVTASGNVTENSCAITVTGNVAYGICSNGAVTQIGNYITVTGEDKAYGLAAMNGGSIIGPKNGLTVTVDATAANGTSYGLYAENGGKIGDAPIAQSFGTGEVLATATGGGNGYALWAETGNVYITGNSYGNPLYYKGTNDENRRYGSGVVISAGFVELMVNNVNSFYNGYYYVELQGTYQIVFIGRDLQGNELGVYNTCTYIPGVGFTSGYEPSAPYSSDPGYTGVWEEYDFSAPADTPEHPEPGAVYTKYVYSTYVKNKFIVCVSYNDDSWSSEYIEVPYLEPVLPYLQMGVREKTGHTFNGVWTCDGIVIDENWTMPAQNYIYIYAQWDRESYSVTIMTGGIPISFDNVETLEQSKDRVVIRGEYQSYFDYTYVAPGYTLDGFYLDPNFTQKYYNNYIPYVEEGEEFILYAKWIESLSLVVLGPVDTYIVMVNIWIDKNGNGAIDKSDNQATSEIIQVGTLEDLFGASEGEIFLDPFEGGGLFGMTDVSQMWLLTFLPEEMSAMLGDRYRVVNWCALDTHPIQLTKGVGSWGIEPDENGLTQIYARLGPAPEKIGALSDMWIDMLSGNALAMPLPRTQTFFGRYFNLLYASQNSKSQDGSDLGGYVYNSYKALTAGEHVIYIGEVGNAGFYTQYEITLCKQDGTQVIIVNGEDGKLQHSSLDVEDESLFLPVMVDMEAGDTLLIRSHQLPNEQGTIEDSFGYMLISLPGIPDGLYDMMDPEGEDPLAVLQFYLVTHCATDFFFYAKSMGDIELPIDSTSTNHVFDGVNGWAVSDETMQPSSTVITAVTPSLTDNPSLWIDIGDLALLYLLPSKDEAGEVVGEAWVGAIIADRYFDPSVLPSLQAVPQSIVVRGAAAVTFQFNAKMPTVGEEATLFFANGLPAGTTLTLIDLSTKYPTYYHYVVPGEEDGITNLALSKFVLSGGEGETFAGCTPKMLFNICYPEEEAPNAESISIGITEEPADIELSFTSTETNEIKLDDREAEDSTSITEDLTIPALTGRGYRDDDIAVLVLRLYNEAGEAVPLPAGFVVEPTSGTIKTYANFAYATLGPVKYFSEDFVLSGEMHLSTFRYLGFEGKAVYEVIVVPAGTDISGASFGGVENTVDTRISCNLSVGEKTRVEFVSNDVNGIVGVPTDGSIPDVDRYSQIGFYVDCYEEECDIEITILQRVNGEFVFTEACTTMLLAHAMGSAIKFDENGKGSLQYKKEHSIIQGMGDVAFLVSQGTPEGVYMITVRHHDSYDTCIVTLTKYVTTE